MNQDKDDVVRKQLSQEEKNELLKVTGQILVKPVFDYLSVHCICGFRHTYKVNKLGNILFKCEELKLEYKTKTVTGMRTKLFNFYASVIATLTHEQRCRTNEIIITRRLLAFAEKKELQVTEHSIKRLMPTLRSLWKDSYLAANDYKYDLSIENEKLQLKFSRGEENV